MIKFITLSHTLHTPQFPITITTFTYAKYSKLYPPKKTYQHSSITNIKPLNKQEILTNKQLSKYDLPSQLPDMTLKQKTAKIVEYVWLVSNSISPKDLNSKILKQLTTEQLTELQKTRHDKLVAILKKLSLKQFSVTAHKILVDGPRLSSLYNKLLWKQIENIFVENLQLTSNPATIRSYAKIFYALTKSKNHRNNPASNITTTTSVPMQNYETNFSMMLPFATPQTLTMILTGFSRMGPISQEFAYIIESLYYKKRDSFNARQKVQIMYVLTRNGRDMDLKIIEEIDKMNLKQILTMLRCYKYGDKLYSKEVKYKQKNILQYAQTHILARKNQINVIDLGQICQLFFEATILKQYPYRLSKGIEELLSQSYRLLKRNVNEVSFMKIWNNLPQVSNSGYLQISFIEEVINTIGILKKKNMFPERIWKVIKASAQDFQNLELRIKIEKIS